MTGGAATGIGLVDVIAPANEDGTQATLLKWTKQIGDRIEKDEPLLELETDKVTVEIASPASGRLAAILKRVDEEVSPGELLARIEVGAESSVSTGAGAGPTAGVRGAIKESGATGAATTAGEVAPITASKLTGANAVIGATEPAAWIAASDSAVRAAKNAFSPSVRKLLAEHGLAADDIAGSGRDGRVTAPDVIRHAAEKQTQGTATAATSVGASTRVPHTAMRRRVASHMARSLAEAPHVTTLFEADLTRVLNHRARHTADFAARGAHLTLTAYFISACAAALLAIPEVNATFHEDTLKLHADANIGIGTALGNKGLIVPVIARAQTLDFFELTSHLNHLVATARAGKLNPEDVRGGTFTISNHGVGGSLLAAPIIINQPQVAILGLGKVERRVCAVMVDGVESISVRSMCYLTLSIDHRALDAFQANAFLSHVVATLEHWPPES